MHYRNPFARAVKDFHEEIDELAAKFVEQGVMPMEALARATEIVKRRRAQRVATIKLP